MSVAYRTDIPAAAVAKPRLKRLRFLAILAATLALGLVSFVFGMFIAVASDLPSLQHFAELGEARSSTLLDDLGRPLGVLSEHNRVIVSASQIPLIVKEAVISIEDKRFETNGGVDIRAIARAFVNDIVHSGSVQGASTIEQQFIKNALQAQSHRTIFEKLREVALAFQLAHKWSKEKILTAYLNTIYFGNGAYGIESAAQTYFGHDVNHLGCGTPGHELCVQQLKPWEAALLAGIIQSPTAYDPSAHPIAARLRRNVVLDQMLEQGYLTRQVYEQSLEQTIPAARDIQAPHQQTIESVDAGYFTSWVAQQVIERYGAARAFNGGLRVKTTLDLDLQHAAEQAVNNYLAYPGGPTASLVAIENSTGEVRAMVGGRSYEQTPFNLATSGERQPGSAFKAFDLAAALEDGISPYSVWSSKPKVFVIHTSAGPERFVVHNDEGAYSGSNTLTGATTFSDNSIYAEVGLRVGTKRIAALARRMGITTPLSTNAAMTIGGLTTGVTPLDMAHAYETIARGGRRVSGTLGEPGEPVGIQEVDAGNGALPDGSHSDINHVKSSRVLSPEIAATETSILQTVVESGTGRAAAIGQFAAGKTGTTSNYGDAWFVGWNHRYTVAVWVGYPNGLVPMNTDFNGKPVLGGTFPALIWHDFMSAAIHLEGERAERSQTHKGGSTSSSGTSTTGSAEGTASTPAGGGGASTQTRGSGGSQTSAPSGATGEHSAGGSEHGTAAPKESVGQTPAAPPSASPPASTPPEANPEAAGGVSPGG